VFWALISFGSGQKNHYLSLFIYLSICLPHGLSLVCSGGRSHLPPPICLPTVPTFPFEVCVQRSPPVNSMSHPLHFNSPPSPG
ncbi:hypothetical protein KUCAC02_018901, partial [Chaenocephalus aceratus]